MIPQSPLLCHVVDTLLLFSPLSLTAAFSHKPFTRTPTSSSRPINRSRNILTPQRFLISVGLPARVSEHNIGSLPASNSFPHQKHGPVFPRCSAGVHHGRRSSLRVYSGHGRGGCTVIWALWARGHGTGSLDGSLGEGVAVAQPPV